MADTAIKEIILVDDEPGVLLALKLLLTALGYSITAFSDPEEALASLDLNTAAQLIISDLRMPKLDGMGLLAGVMQKRPDLPFILMSGHATGEDVEHAKKLGAKGFLAKPFTPDQLQATLKSL